MENSSDEVKDVTAPQTKDASSAPAAQESTPAQDAPAPEPSDSALAPEEHERPPAQDDWEEAPSQVPQEPELAEEPAPEQAPQGAQDAPPTEAPQEAEPDQEPQGEAAAEQPSDAEQPADAEQPSEAEQAATVEAVLFAADTPLPPAKVSQVVRLPQKAVRAAIATLNHRYEQIGAAFRIEEIAGGLQMLTLGKYHEVLERLFRERSDSRLSQAALETLAVIAYRQPVLRADIEAIRGVACGEVLRGLMEKQLIRIDGRAQILGRPLLYGTTRRFLEVFGLASLEDLPKSEELRMPAQKPAEAAPAAPIETTSPAPSAAPEVAPSPTDAGANATPSSTVGQSQPSPTKLPVSDKPPGLCPGVDLDNSAALEDVMEQGENPV
jgi:segregation and condensation protein B